LLLANGVRGVTFSEDFETREVNVRFAKDVGGHLRTVSVSLRIPEPPIPKRKRPVHYRWIRGRHVLVGKLAGERQEQMARSTYRALHYWLKSQFEAVAFGLLTFEDVFLSHFEWLVGDKRVTVGQIIGPRLASDVPLLPASIIPKDIVEGSFKEVKS
jgi:hypothetical protein